MYKYKEQQFLMVMLLLQAAWTISPEQRGCRSKFSGVSDFSGTCTSGALCTHLKAETSL